VAQPDRRPTNALNPQCDADGEPIFPTTNRILGWLASLSPVERKT